MCKIRNVLCIDKIRAGCYNKKNGKIYPDGCFKRHEIPFLWMKAHEGR